MSAHVRFVSGATIDHDDAADWYEVRQNGLGNRLFSAVDVAVDSILRWPNAGRPVEESSARGVREVPVAGFPYRIVYRSEAETMTILAIAHERRPPGYWKGRPDA